MIDVNVMIQDSIKKFKAQCISEIEHYTKMKTIFESYKKRGDPVMIYTWRIQYTDDPTVQEILNLLEQVMFGLLDEGIQNATGMCDTLKGLLRMSDRALKVLIIDPKKVPKDIPINGD